MARPDTTESENHEVLKILKTEYVNSGRCLFYEIKNA